MEAEASAEVAEDSPAAHLAEALSVVAVPRRDGKDVLYLSRPNVLRRYDEIISYNTDFRQFPRALSRAGSFLALQAIFAVLARVVNLKRD